MKNVDHRKKIGITMYAMKRAAILENVEDSSFVVVTRMVPVIMPAELRYPVCT